MRNYRFVVNIQVPDDFDEDDEGIEGYVRDALQAWCGSMDPETDLFDIDKYIVVTRA